MKKVMEHTMQGLEPREGESLADYNARWRATFGALRAAERSLCDRGRAIRFDEGLKMKAHGAQLYPMHEFMAFYTPGDELMLDGQGEVVPMSPERRAMLGLAPIRPA